MLQLGYWNVRGYGEPSRLLLKHLGIEFQDTRYDFGENNDSVDSWYKVKFTLGLPFPNLPYLIDGDFKLTQVRFFYEYSP